MVSSLFFDDKRFPLVQSRCGIAVRASRSWTPGGLLVPAGDVAELHLVADVLRAGGRERGAFDLLERPGEFETERSERSGIGLDHRGIFDAEKRPADELDVNGGGELFDGTCGVRGGGGHGGLS